MKTTKLLFVMFAGFVVAACGGGGSGGAATNATYEALPVASSTVSDAVAIWTANQAFDITPSCGGSVTVACPGGNPSNPVPQITLTPASSSVTATANSMTYTFSSQVSLASVIDFPIAFSGLTCNVKIDTAPGGSPTVQISGDAVFDSLVPAGPVNRLHAMNVVITGLEAQDITLSGGALCTLTGALVTTISGAITSPLSNMIASHSLCGAPGAPLFTACP